MIFELFFLKVSVRLTERYELPLVLDTDTHIKRMYNYIQIFIGF